MGWLSILGDIAAPFTGGLSAIAGNAIDAATSGGGPSRSLPTVLGAASGGAAAGRKTQAELDQERYRNVLAGVQQELAQQKQLQGQGQLDYNNAVRGGLLQGLQDVKITAPPGIPMGTVTGGLRPSAITNKSDIGSQMQQAAMLDLLSNNPGGASARLSGINIPTAPALPNESAGMQAIDVAGPALGITGTIANLLNPQKKKPWQQVTGSTSSGGSYDGSDYTDDGQ